MAACCTFCKGTGREQGDNGVTFTLSRCTFCNGSGGWNEIDAPLTAADFSFAAKLAVNPASAKMGGAV